MKPDSVKNVLSLMLSCGLYNYSGDFAFKVTSIYLASGDILWSVYRKWNNEMWVSRLYSNN